MKAEKYVCKKAFLENFTQYFPLRKHTNSLYLNNSKQLKTLYSLMMKYTHFVLQSQSQ